MNDQNQDEKVHQSTISDKVWLMVGLVLLLATLAIAMFSNDLNDNSAFILNILVAAGVAMLTQGLTGFTKIDLPILGKGKLRAGGSLAVLFGILFISPFQQGKAPEHGSSVPIVQEKRCLFINGLHVKPDTFDSLQEFTEKAELTLSGDNDCGRPVVAGLYLRFGEAVDKKNHTMRANPVKADCTDKHFDPSCWRYQNPVPLSAKKGEWTIKVPAPSFVNLSEVKGDVTLNWEARDFDNPEKEPPLGKSSLTITIANRDE